MPVHIASFGRRLIAARKSRVVRAALEIGKVGICRIRHMRARSAVLALVSLLTIATSGSAQPPTVAISSSGPLGNIWMGNELSCQISYAGDTVDVLFPSGAVPGDCGTFLAVGGVLFAPNFAAHTTTATSGIGAYTAFTPVSQSAVSGSGSISSPFAVTTVAAAGATGLQITQIDSYVVGQESYRTDVTVANNAGGAQSVVLYRAGDCYLQGTDVGFGFLGPEAGAVGCSANANNTPAGRIEQWLPITGGDTWLQSTNQRLVGDRDTHAVHQHVRVHLNA